MIRPFRDEAERYGHYSLAAESMYDHPFQWGSKRTGPDLARVGGKYSDDWQVAHLIDPRSVVPESIMPAYAFLLDTTSTRRHRRAPAKPCGPSACPTPTRWSRPRGADLVAQASVDGDHDGVLARYPKAAVGDFDGQPGRSDRDGRAGRLPADPRPDGRLHGDPRRGHRSSSRAGGVDSAPPRS